MRLRTTQVVFLVVGGALIATTAVAFAAPMATASHVRAASFFALMGLIALALAYQMPTGASGNISFIPFLSALPLAPSLPLVLMVFLVVFTSEKLQKRTLQKAVFNSAQYALSIAFAILAYSALGGLAIDPTTRSWYIGQFVAAYAVFLLLNTASVSLVISTSQHKRFLAVWGQVAGGAVLYDLFAVPVVYGFGYVFQRWGPVPALFVAVPLFGLRQLYKTNYQLETLNHDLLRLIVSTVEARDPYTSGHSERVAVYTALICKAVGVTPRLKERIQKAALLHDVGKIHEEFAPILRKPGQLTAAEYEIMKTHAAKGAVIVGQVTQFADIVPMIRAHHEGWDGCGYPDLLRGEEIPLGARIIAIADTIDAMSTDRPYREGLAPELIRAELLSKSGTQFSPLLIGAIVVEGVWDTISRQVKAEQFKMRQVVIDPVGPLFSSSTSRSLVEIQASSPISGLAGHS